MKVKIGNKNTTLSKDVVAAHMANLLTTRSILLGGKVEFRQSFIKNKDLCIEFLRENKTFIYNFGDEEWLDDFLDFQKNQHELIMQDVFFKFSDGSVWTISLHDIVNLKIIKHREEKLDKIMLLKNPIELIQWAQDELEWDQLKNFAILKNIVGNEEKHVQEWRSVDKKIIKWTYTGEE